MKLLRRAVTAGLQPRVRTSLQHFAAYARDSLSVPPRENRLERVVYGLAQPVLAIRLLHRDRPMLQAALAPALLLGLVCALAALLKAEPGYLEHLKYFYTTFAVLAPVPPIVLSRHYARLASTAYSRMGFGSSQPYYKGLFRTLWEALAQVIIIAVAVAPVTGLLKLLPTVGQVIAATVAAIWALHWIVVEALDNARVLRVGQTDALMEAREEGAVEPWFVRSFRHTAARMPRPLRWPIEKFAGLCAWLSKPWGEEIALVEAHPWLVAGFSLTTALLLAIPGLNLLFRPIIIVASAHLMGQLEADTSSVQAASMQSQS